MRWNDDTHRVGKRMIRWRESQRRDTWPFLQKEGKDKHNNETIEGHEC